MFIRACIHIHACLQCILVSSINAWIKNGMLTWLGMGYLVVSSCKRCKEQDPNWEFKPHTRQENNHLQLEEESLLLQTWRSGSLPCTLLPLPEIRHSHFVLVRPYHKIKIEKGDGSSKTENPRKEIDLPKCAREPTTYTAISNKQWVAVKNCMNICDKIILRL